jgi:drug/metabolite transporter (DMT)-like permease
MTHRRAVGLMVLVTLMWSIAGVVTRWLHVVEAFEVTFWRSLFNAVALGLLLLWWRGPWLLAYAFKSGGRTLWLSGLCWSVMFTAFMVAITLTTVANVLVTMALAPLFTALLARFVLGNRLALRTWAAIVVAGVGIGWMYGADVQGAEPRHLLGVLVALGVPIAAAVNWTLIQHNAASKQDLLPAVLIGALISAALTLPLAWPLASGPHDLGLLALLGTVQLAIPCLIAVSIARVLPAPEVSLLALLEVIFGVAWAWLGANEAPSVSVLGGGALVLGALVLNESLALRSK